MLLKAGVATPSTPPLDPPLIIAPKATKTPAVAFVCDKSNVYLIRGEE